MLPRSCTCSEPANSVGFCYKSKLHTANLRCGHFAGCNKLKFYAMEALNIALEIEHASEIDKFYLDLLYFLPDFLSVDFQASSSTPLEPPYWRWAVCGKPSVFPRKDKLGEIFLKKTYSLMEQNWCCSEFWFHLFRSSCFVTLGIHIWIIGIQSDSLYHK